MTAAWIRMEHAGWRWRLRPEAEARIRARGWEPPAGDGADWRIVQNWGSRVAALSLPPDAGLFVKWYAPRHAGERLRFALAPSRPEAEWRTIAALAEAGVPTAECLAVGERRRFGLWRGGVLVLRAVEPALTLAAHLAMAAEREARRAGEAMARLAARLHAAGFRHGDLHADNVLVERPGEADERLLLVDLHEAAREADERAWLGDLARLNAYAPGGRNLRLRFWLRYEAARGLPRARRREWLAGVDRETRQLWERHRRKRGESIERY